MTISEELYLKVNANLEESKKIKFRYSRHYEWTTKVVFWEDGDFYTEVSHHDKKRHIEIINAKNHIAIKDDKEKKMEFIKK